MNNGVVVSRKFFAASSLGVRPLSLASRRFRLVDSHEAPLRQFASSRDIICCCSGAAAVSKNSWTGDATAVRDEEEASACKFANSSQDETNLTVLDLCAAALTAMPAKQGAHALPSNDSFFLPEIKRISGLAGPLMVQNVFGYLMTVVSIAAIGRIGAAELAAASLATSIYTVTGQSVVMGLSSAMETLCGQAYGAKDYKALGDTLQRSLLVCWTACIPVALLWLNSCTLMTAIGQDVEISAMAGRYLAMCIPCIFLDIASDCMKKYLQAQSIVAPGAYATTVATILSPVFFYVAIFQLHLGLDGAALALIMCHLTPLLGIFGYVVWHAKQTAGNVTSTWRGFSAQAATSKWGEYLTYGIPAMLMISLDWWVYEAAVLMTGCLPNAQAALSVGGICVSLNTWVYMVPVGLSSAVNTCVSNALGSGDGDGAKRVAATGLGLAIVLQSLVIFSVLTFGESLIRMIATDPSVVSLAMGTLPVLCALMFWDGINVTMSGVLRGSGKQAIGALISAGTFVIAVGACYFFAFQAPPWLFDLFPAVASLEPVARVWMGVAVAVVCQTAVLLSVISQWDWQEQADGIVASLAEGPGRKIIFAGGH